MKIFTVNVRRRNLDIPHPFLKNGEQLIIPQFGPIFWTQVIADSYHLNGPGEIILYPLGYYYVESQKKWQRDAENCSIFSNLIKTFK
jgi:hypothetical protein